MTNTSFFVHSAACCCCSKLRIVFSFKSSYSDSSNAMALHPQLGKKVFHIRNAADISKFLVLIPNFISNVEEEAIIQFLGPKLQRKRYESGHWDNVIHKYKEAEILTDSMPEVVSKTVERLSNFIRETTGSSQMKFMSPHVLDLSSDGHIAPHVDSLKFSGGIVAGLSLLSTRLLRLAPDHSDDNFRTIGALSDPSFATTPYYNLSYTNGFPEKQEDLLWKHDTFTGSDQIFDGSIEVLLPRRSIYILAGPLRYSFTHEILGADGQPKFISEKPTSERRLSLILRDELEQGT